MRKPAFHGLELLLVAFLATSMPFLGGCNKQDAARELQEVEEAAGEAATKVTEGLESAVEEGEQMASELSEQAQAYLSPLKDKLGSLEELKQTPAELKTAVGDLIEMIEQKADEIELSESVSDALATLKEKLIALRDYLEGVHFTGKLR